MKRLLFLALLTAAAVRRSSADDFPHLSDCKRWEFGDVGDGGLQSRLERLAKQKNRYVAFSVALYISYLLA